MTDLEFCIMTAISDISVQLDIIETVLNTHIIIKKNININVRSIYTMLDCMYNDLVSFLINWFSSRDDSDDVLTVDTE